MILQEKIQKKSEVFGKLAPAFLEGAKFALNNMYINYQEQKPSKLKDRWAGILGTRRGELPRTMFPEVQWSDDEPTKVKLIIEK